jgi:DNA-binding NarL/FixJ family response regulator
MSIRVIIADDHTLLRSGLRALLARTPDIRVIAEAQDGREAMALVGVHQPDVVLMDVAMLGLNGLEAAGHAAKHYPHVRVIMLSMHKNEEYVLRALQVGAAGYLLKDAAAGELEAAIRAVMAGEQYLSRAVAQQLADYEERFGGQRSEDNAFDRLTAREREVLQLIAEGNTMQQIASTLGISVKTVETHRYRLMDKLNIHHVTGLVRYAVRAGIVQDE